MSRRQFASTSALAALSAAIVPSRVLGAQAPSNKLNIAAIGIGGMGASNLRALEGETIVALCDVDRTYAAKTVALYPQARLYRDYRVMLEKEKGIDAVVIATPDHTHAVITMAVLQAGKHVFCQKPLTHTIFEARKITEAARRYKVVTQMGNQGHSYESMRVLKEWLDDGAIGKVTEVHAWTDRPVAATRGRTSPRWRGPPTRRPSRRRWTGTCGSGQPVPAVPPRVPPDEMAGVAGLRHGCPGRHGLPHPRPGVLGARAGLSPDGPGHFDALPARGGVADLPARVDRPLRVPARGKRPPVKLTWYDGRLLPPIPPELEPGRPCRRAVPCSSGTRGRSCTAPTAPTACASSPRSACRSTSGPPRSCAGSRRVTRATGSARARRGRADPAVLPLRVRRGPHGDGAARDAGPPHEGPAAEWDGASLRFTNNEKANELLHTPYREGWTL